jgi:AraC-like DNA-binding protein
MKITATLSPKLPLLARHGFALGLSREPHYEFEWHRHDCAMLLWPRLGSLRTAWLDDGARPAAAQTETETARLIRSTALLLPPGTAHQTKCEAARQQHGELYLAPELLGRGAPLGALRLDAAALALLDALLAPGLSAPSAAHLVPAIVAQLQAAQPLRLVAEPASLPQRMIRRLAAALEADETLPPIDTVAGELGVSTRQLQRSCHQEFGASPVELRRRLLAAHARSLLDAGRPLADVSRQLGFTTSGHLTRLLRGVHR